jgi:protocatechuate 3,4-dioxygenase beta subunit
MLKTIKIIIFLLFSLNTISIVYADNKNMFIPNNLNSCKPLKISYNNYEPKEFNPSNNLLRTFAGINHVKGKEIVIKGKLVDKNCIPISDAKVYIWHVGFDGKYPYEPLKNKINQDLISEGEEDGFQGSGVYTTNNLGEFNFITIYPGQIKNEMAHVNIKAVHSDYGSLQTKIYLEPIPQIKVEKESEELMSYIVVSALDKEKDKVGWTEEDMDHKSNERIKRAPSKVELKAKRDPKKLTVERGFLVVHPNEKNTYEFTLVTPFQNKFRRY